MIGTSVRRYHVVKLFPASTTLNMEILLYLELNLRIRSLTKQLSVKVRSPKHYECAQRE